MGAIEVEDALEEILSWLPPKSLFRLKSVNKHWHRLISSFIKNPRFALKQVSNTNKRITFPSSTSLIFRRGRSFYAYRRYDHDRPLSILTAKSHGGELGRPGRFLYNDLNLPRVRGGASLFDLGSVRDCYHCNGILCLVDSFDRLMLWNPEIREYRLVPGLIPSPGQRNTWWSTQGLGFGCDTVGPTYKIVMVSFRLISSANDDDDEDDDEGSRRKLWIPGGTVYNMSTNSWRRIQSGKEDHILKTLFCNLGEGVYCNDRYYWLVSGLGPPMLLSFDFRSESFGALPMPPLPECPLVRPFDVRWKMTLRMGSVTLFSIYTEEGFPGTNSVGAWVLDGRFVGVEGAEVLDYWRPCFSAGPFKRKRSPLMFLESDEVLMMKEDLNLSVYNIRSNKLWKFDTDRDDLMEYWGLYVKSVASVW